MNRQQGNRGCPLQPSPVAKMMGTRKDDWTASPAQPNTLQLSLFALRAIPALRTAISLKISGNRSCHYQLKGKKTLLYPCGKYSITNHPQCKMLLFQVWPTPLTKSELKEMSRTPNLETINHFVKEQPMKHLAAGLETHFQKFLRSN